MGCWVDEFMGSWVDEFMGSWVHGFMGSWGSWVHRETIGGQRHKEPLEAKDIRNHGGQRGPTGANGNQ